MIQSTPPPDQTPSSTPTLKNKGKTSTESVASGALKNASIEPTTSLASHSGSRLTPKETKPIKITISGTKIEVKKDPVSIESTKAQLQKELTDRKNTAFIARRTALTESMNNKLTRIKSNEDAKGKLLNPIFGTNPSAREEENKKLRSEIEDLSAKLGTLITENADGLPPTDKILKAEFKTIDAEYSSAFRKLGFVEYIEEETSPSERTLSAKVSPKAPKKDLPSQEEELRAQETYENLIRNFTLSGRGTLTYNKEGNVHDTGLTPIALKQMIRTAQKVEGSVKINVRSFSREIDDVFYAEARQDGSVKITQMGKGLAEGSFGVISNAFDLTAKSFDVLKIPLNDDPEVLKAIELASRNAYYVNADGNERGLVAPPKYMFKLGGEGGVAILQLHRYDGDLVQNLKRVTGMTPEQKLRAIEDLFHGGAVLDAKMVSHLDIKPQNILIEGNTAVLADLDGLGIFEEDPESFLKSRPDKVVLAVNTKDLSVGESALDLMSAISLEFECIATRLSGTKQPLFDPMSTGRGLDLGLTPAQLEELKAKKEVTIPGVGKLTDYDSPPPKCIFTPDPDFRKQQINQVQKLMGPFKKLAIQENHAAAISLSALTMITGELFEPGQKLGSINEVNWDGVEKNILKQLSDGIISQKHADAYFRLIDEVIKPALTPHSSLRGQRKGLDRTDLERVLILVNKESKPLQCSHCEEFLTGLSKDLGPSSASERPTPPSLKWEEASEESTEYSDEDSA